MLQTTLSLKVAQNLSNLRIEVPMTKQKGKSLPPKLIIKLGKFVWTTLWHMMVSKLAPAISRASIFVPAASFGTLWGRRKVTHTHQWRDATTSMSDSAALGRIEPSLCGRSRDSKKQYRYPSYLLHRLKEVGYSTSRRRVVAH